MIEFRNVHAAYDDQLPVLRDVGFTIDDGEFVAFVGTNGAGKSTTMRLMNGLLKPSEGTVLLNGTPTTELRTSEIARKVGFLFQNPDRQICCNTVREELLFGFKAQGRLDEQAQEKVDAMIEHFNFDADAEPFLLNRGTRQLLALASILVTEPEVLILDEPTAGLDPRGREVILSLVRTYREQTGSTVILVSHSMEDVAKYVERIIVMNHGQVMFDNTPCEVFKHYKELEQIGLAAPQVTYLMHELKEKGLNVNTEATTVAEARESLLEVLLGREPNHRGSNLEEENLC